MNDPSAPTPTGDDLDVGRPDAEGQQSPADPADPTRASSPSDPAPSSHRPPPSDSESVDVESIDLDVIERDLDDVQIALERLNDGSYWTDEVTGEAIPDDVLAAHPTARTVSPTLA